MQKQDLFGFSCASLFPHSPDLSCLWRHSTQSRCVFWLLSVTGEKLEKGCVWPITSWPRSRGISSASWKSSLHLYWEMRLEQKRSVFFGFSSVPVQRPVSTNVRSMCHELGQISRGWWPLWVHYPHTQEVFWWTDHKRKQVSASLWHKIPL